MRPSTPTYAADQLRADPRDFRIPRTADRDLAFRGWPLSHAEERSGSPGALRGVDVDIYMTIGLRLVGHVCHWSLDDGEGFREEHHVAVHDTAPDLVQWLKQDNAGLLDAPRKRAWIGACQAWPGLKREAVERVD
ncbi:MAG: hypothetical protein E6K55_04310 [Gemmatimonadetes bacterium]|nr:MAG: hypothetical protein E6K55_04310 [Gemmatimonadota bacterium]